MSPRKECENKRSFHGPKLHQSVTGRNLSTDIDSSPGGRLLVNRGGRLGFPLRNKGHLPAPLDGRKLAGRMTPLVMNRDSWKD